MSQSSRNMPTVQELDSSIIEFPDNDNEDNSQDQRDQKLPDISSSIKPSQLNFLSFCSSQKTINNVGLGGLGMDSPQTGRVKDNNPLTKKPNEHLSIEKSSTQKYLHEPMSVLHSQ